VEKRFVGRVALVTGAASGIGQAAAVRLAQEGALVGVNHRPGGTDPGKTMAMIEEADGEAFAVPADMRDPEQVVAMVNTVADRGGRFDYLVSNAAINPFLPWDRTTIDDWNAICETNLRGTWVVTTEAAKQMIRFGNGGAIVCVSSISAHVGAPYQSAYCATKGGISMWCKALGSVVGTHGIRVNAVEPGWILTKMAEPMFDDPAAVKYYEERIALHRPGEPSEVAGIIAFLLSDDASYVTSATLLGDAGFIVNAEL
jgi:NAD(P)-dependent dehydrogenase (short-subunit alcohol dehydrogenase family)